jgi:hypothetical protein
MESTQHHEGFLEGFAERPDLFQCVVGSERSAEGARHTKTGHEWLAAMVSGPKREAHLIKQSAEIVVMDPLEVE